MAEGRSVHNEKETLGKSVKSQHKYGTTNRASSTSTYPEYYIRHIVQKDDTLAGIALKYGCSMQQVKAVNSIHCDWQFASLKVVFIPVSVTDGYTSDDLVTRQEMLSFQKLTRTTSDSKIAKNESHSGSDYLRDYFSKFDTSLAEIKGSMEKLAQSISAREDSDNPLLMLPSRKSPRPVRGVWNADVESLDLSQEPEMQFKSQSTMDSSAKNGGVSSGSARTSRSYRVPSASSWQQMERTHDDLFQL